MAVNVLVFGSLTEATGEKRLQLDVPDTEVLRSQLTASYPGLGEKPFTMAVNQSIVNKKTELNDGDEVALLPPYAGG